MSKKEIVESIMLLKKAAEVQLEAVLYDKKQQDAAVYYQGQIDALSLLDDSIDHDVIADWSKKSG